MFGVKFNFNAYPPRHLFVITALVHYRKLEFSALYYHNRLFFAPAPYIYKEKICAFNAQQLSSFQPYLYIFKKEILP